MKSGRKPSSSTRSDGSVSMPWYKAYPGNDMGSSSFYNLNANERGLLLSLRHVFWLDGRVPSDIKAMSRCARLDADDVREALTQAVLDHFEVDPNDDGYMVCIDLHRQRVALGAVRQKQSEGGRSGAEKANAYRAGKPEGQPAGRPERNRQVNPRVASSTSTSTSTSTSSSPRTGEDEPSCSADADAWVAEYTQEELAGETAIRGNGASGGAP